MEGELEAFLDLRGFNLVVLLAYVRESGKGYLPIQFIFLREVGRQGGRFR